MRDFIKDMTSGTSKGAVEIQNANGTLKSTYEIIKELGAVWNELGDKQKAVLLEEIAGKHQSKVLSAILQNYDQLEKVYDSANNSAGSAMKEQMAYMDSIEGRANAFRETLKKVWIDSISTDTVKDMVSLGTTILQVFDTMVQKFGLIPTVIGTATLALSLFNKEFYNGLVKNIPIVGNLNKAMGTMTTSIQNALGEKIISSFTRFSDGLTSAKAKTATLTVANGVLTASLKMVEVGAMLANAALTMGLSFALTAVISKAMEFADSLIMTKKELKEFNAEITDTVKQSNSNISNVSNMLKEITNLESQLANATDISERSKIEEEILDKRKQIAEIYPMTVSYIDSEGNAIANNNSLIESQVALEKQKIELKAQEFMQENKNIGQEIQGLRDKQQLYNDMRMAQMRGEKTVGKIESFERGGQKYTQQVDVKVSDSKIKELNEEITDITLKMGQFKQLQSSLGQEFLNSDLGAPWREVNDEIDSYTQSLEENKLSASNNKYANDDVANGLDNVKEKALEAKDAIKGLSDEFANTNDTISLLKGALEEFKNNNGTISADTYEKFFATGDTELIAMLGNVNTFEKNINDKLKEQEQLRLQIRDNTIQQAIASEQYSKTGVDNAVNSENAKTQATADGASSRNGITENEISNNANSYGTDVQNKANAEITKGQVTANSINQRSAMGASEVSNNASNYGADAQNKANAENSKVQVTVSSVNQMAGSITGAIGSLATVYGQDANNYASSLNSKLGATANYVNQTNSMLSSINLLNSLEQGGIKGLANTTVKGIANEVKSKVAELKKTSGVKTAGNVGFTPVSSNYKPVGISSPKTSSGSGGSKSKGSKGSGSSSGTKTDIKDTEVKIDRYKQLQDAIDDVNNSLSQNNILQEQAKGKDKLKYIKEEINLLNQKRKALKDIEKEMQKEAKELENKLKKQGLNAKNGDITNYVFKLEAQKKKVNSMANTDKNKEKAIKELEELIKTADRYFELTSNELPKIQNEWLEITSTIEDQRKQYVQLMADTERQVSDMIKNELEKRKKEEEKLTDKLKEEVEKRRKLYNDEISNEDYEKEKKTKQEELAKLELQIEEASRDTSREGKLVLEELLKQKEEIQNELNQIIKDKQHELGNEVFDKELEDIDKNLQDKFDKLDEKYTEEKISQMAKELISNGFLEIEGKVVNLQSAMNDFFKEQNGAYSDMNLNIKEMNDNLELTKKLYSELANMNSDLGTKGGRSISDYSMSRSLIPDLQLPNISLPNVNGRSGDISISMPFTVQGNITEDVMPEVNKALNKFKSEVTNEIAKAIGVY